MIPEPNELLEGRKVEEPARGRWTHAADAVAAICAAHRGFRFGIVAGDVTGGKRRRIVRAVLNCGGDRLRIGADVETVRTVRRQLLQERSERRVLHDGANWLHGSVRVVEDCPRFGRKGAGRTIMVERIV